MDSSTGITPVMPIGNTYGDGFGGNSFIWIFGLLILMGMFNGGFGWGNNSANALGYENLATSNEVQRGFDNQNLQAQTRDILTAVNSGTAQSVAATNQAKYDNINVAKDIQMALSSQINDVKSIEQSLLANQNECCCSTKMLIAETGAGINAGIAQNRYENALNTASINANTTAQTQRILDAIAQDKIEALQSKVSALELQNSLAGVVRYPTNTYYAVPSPCFGGCGCNV